MKASVPWFSSPIYSWLKKPLLSSLQTPIFLMTVNRTKYSRTKIKGKENGISFSKLSDATGVAYQRTSYGCFPKMSLKIKKLFDPLLKGVSPMPSPEKQLSGNSRAVGIPSTALPGPSWSHGLPTVAVGDVPGGQNHRSPWGPSLGAGAGTVSSPIPRANPELRKGMRGSPWQRREKCKSVF